MGPKSKASDGKGRQKEQHSSFPGKGDHCPFDIDRDNKFNFDYEANATLWILKLHILYSRILRSNLLASVFIAYVPIVALGFMLQMICQYRAFTRAGHIALIWVAFAPLLIQKVLKLMLSFMNSHKGMFVDKKTYYNLCRQEIQRMQSPNALLFGIPWAIAVTTIILISTYKESPLVIQIWAGISFFTMFFISARGFYGIYVVLNLIRKMLNSGVTFNPYHPDKFGGLTDFGNFGVRIALYFSSGALAIPFPIEIIKNHGNDNSYLNLAVYLIAGIFIAVMFASFLIPIFQVKNHVDPKKERLILEARDELDDMIGEYSQSEDVNLKKGIEIGLHYYFRYKKLLEIKDYPLDFKKLMEFCLSFIIPIFVAVLQFLE